MPMTLPPTTLERAFQLARSGDYPTIEALRRQLRLEGFRDQNWQISGPALISQLKKLCALSKRATATPE